MRKAGDGMRYAHTWRSRRVKRWIGMIVLAVAVVFVVSVATSSSKKSENLPNLEAEYCIKFSDMHGEKPEWGKREKAAETAIECHVLHECYVR